MFDETDKKKTANFSTADARSSSSRGDAAVTAEFDYIDDWGEELAQKASTGSAPASEVHLRARAHKEDAADPVTRAMDGMDHAALKMARGQGVPADLGSGTGAWGFEQPQVSGVFSRYEEETQDTESDEFDLFEEEPSTTQPEHPLREYVSAHDKKIRRLTKQVAYQKEIIQVISELLVEAQVISKHELKKRLRALRTKSS